MSLETKSQELKNILAGYDTQWFLGDLSGLMKHIANGTAKDQLGKLSSPLRQLYFLGGLHISSVLAPVGKTQHNKEDWSRIVELLNEIEQEYDRLFFPQDGKDLSKQEILVRTVAMPSFLSYFNQGPLNYEKQTIEWIRELFSKLDVIISPATNLVTEDFLQFYENLDFLVQSNFQGFSSKHKPVRPNWEKYTKLKIVNTAPPELKYKPSEPQWAMYHFVADHGLINRFFPAELSSKNLSEEKVNAILHLLSCSPSPSDYLFYTSTKPGNPLLEKPIIALEGGMYQVFEVKQVIHAIQYLLEATCSSNTSNTTKYIEKKGKLLEEKVVQLFTGFLGAEAKLFRSYYVDGCEQDILILWKRFAFIIEAKGYALKEPFRDPNKAYIRIKNDFESCIGYGYSQTRRVEKKFIDEAILYISDKNGNVLTEIDSANYDQDFSIIVNLESFGQVQNDLSTLLRKENEEDMFPWAVCLDDLEVFLLTMKAKGKKPIELVNFLLMRENLHGKLICSDELEVCAGFLTRKLTEKNIKYKDTIATTPDLPAIFDLQYNLGMGFKNEKYLADKKSGKVLFY